MKGSPLTRLCDVQLSFRDALWRRRHSAGCWDWDGGAFLGRELEAEVTAWDYRGGYLVLLFVLVLRGDRCLETFTQV